MRLIGFTCGWLDTDMSLILDGADGAIRIPIPAFYLEHQGRSAVFDTGLHPDVRVDVVTRLGYIADYYDCVLPEGTAIDERLHALDVDPSHVELMISSHLHFDHAGGNALLPNARHLVQRDEWDLAMTRAGSYDPQDFDLGHDRLLLDGEHDLFGDGRAVLLPTCGHTAGHQSLRVRTDDGRTLVLCGDACYLRGALDDDRLPPFVWDAGRQRDSYRLLRDMERSGAELVFGHDPGQWEGGATADVAASTRVLAG